MSRTFRTIPHDLFRKRPSWCGETWPTLDHLKEFDFWIRDSKGRSWVMMGVKGWKEQYKGKTKVFAKTKRHRRNRRHAKAFINDCINEMDGPSKKAG